MRKRNVTRALMEALESRHLLSAAIQTYPLVSSTSTSVQAVAALTPTYKKYVASGELAPFDTAGPEGYSPAEIRAAYGMNQISFGSVAGDGTGQTIAIIDAYNDPTIQHDLQAFDAAFGLANPTLKVVSQTGSATLPPVDPAGKGNDNFEGEEALDVEWAHAMAPGATIMLVEAQDASPSNLFSAVNFARQQAGVSVVSMSFGGNETSDETQFDADFTTPAGHNGVTFVASTGDSGEPGGYPAFSPNVVATGGTSLAIDSVGNYQSETGWSGSGGGVSQVEPQPSYQNGIVTQSSTGRATPDVAFDADPSTGVSVYDSYNNGTSKPWEVLGGTSVAAPAWSGIIAVADEGRAIAGEGTLDSRSATLPLLYSAPAADFHDITTGNNGFSAGFGYDLVTGRGSPKANLIVPYLVNGVIVTTPPPTGPTVAGITASATTVTEGTSVILTAEGVSDTGATGVAVTFYEETNGITGLQTGTNGDFAFTPVTDGSNALTLDTSNAVGTFTFYAQVTDASGGASATGTAAPSITVTVVAASTTAPTIASISATPDPVVSGDTLTLTASGITDPTASISRVYFYEETNGVPGLQTGPDGDFGFRPTRGFDGYSLDLDTTGVTGSLTFYGLAVDDAGNISAEGTAAPSTTVSIASDALPDAPTGLTATAVSTTEIDLAYSETDSGQTGFTIQRALDPNFTSFTQLFTINRPDVFTYIDTNLTPGTNYYYRVEAFNIAGDSDFSNVANAVTPLPAAKLAIAQQPINATAGVAVNAVVVNLVTVKNQVASADNSMVTLTIAGGPTGATLGGTVTVQAVNGVAVFDDLTFSIAGRYTLLASDANLVTAVTRSFAVVANTATARLVVTQMPASTLVGKNIEPSLVVALEDGFGNLITNLPRKVFVSIAGGPVGGVLKGGTSATFTRGVAKFHNLLLTESGTYTLRLTDPIANTAVLDFTEIIVPGSTFIPVPRPVNVSAGKSRTLAIHLATTTPSGVPFTGSVNIEDQNGNIFATAFVNRDGTARFLLSGLAVGAYSTKITYSGDTNHVAATSGTFGITVS